MPVQKRAKSSVGNVDRAVTADRETPSHRSERLGAGEGVK